MKTQRFVLAAFAAAPCFAQTPEEPAAEAPVTLDPVVVTATRSEQRLSEIAASAHVISRAEIERAQANDLADLLRTIAGVDVTHSGGPGSPASVFIRGAESNHTLFLVDGVRYTTETFLNAQVQNLAPEMIERIEVVKGPRSALWGSDAVGGVVHIVTRRARPGRPSGGSAVRIGSFGTRDLSAFVGDSGAAGDFGVSLQMQDFAGFPALKSGGPDRGHENLNAALNGGIAIGAMRLALRHVHADGINEYVSFGAPLSQDFENRISAVDLAAPVTDAWRTRLTASVAYDEIVQREPSDPARPELFDFTRVERRALEWENTVHVGRYALIGGLATGSSELDNAFFSTFGDSATHERSERHAAFAQIQAAVAGFDTLVAGRFTDHEEFGSHGTGQIEVARLVGDARIGLAYGNAFKEPELTDLHGAFGNPDVGPERSTSLEANLRLPLSPRQVFTAAAFDTRIRDLIVFTTLPENVERARIRGLEAGWRYDDGVWNAGLSASAQNPVNRDTGERLLRRSRESGQLALGRRFGPLSAQVEGLAHGTRKDVGDVTLAGYALVNASLLYAPGTSWTVGLRGENLLDEDYELIDGFRTAGRSGFLTLRGSF